MNDKIAKRPALLAADVTVINSRTAAVAYSEGFSTRAEAVRVADTLTERLGTFAAPGEYRVVINYFVRVD